jgi:hypothetical protein
MKSVSGEQDRQVPAKTELVNDLVTTLVESVSGCGRVVPADLVFFEVLDVDVWKVHFLGPTFSSSGRGERKA